MNEKDKAAGRIVIGLAGAAGGIVAPSSFGKLTAAAVAALCALGWVYLVEPATDEPAGLVVPIGMATERDVAVPVATVSAVARIGLP